MKKKHKRHEPETKAKPEPATKPKTISERPAAALALLARARRKH